MTTQPDGHNEAAEVVWDRDGVNGSCVADFDWPEGAEVRGSINLGQQNVIDRKEVNDDWLAISNDLLQRI
ncbi:MAG: hypothetical protein HN350_03580 [Phycisphaerales bacterium]|jgi:hypothetical protein|nr:hypothetical protein [Phycisphaerales bacterium]